MHKRVIWRALVASLLALSASVALWSAPAAAAPPTVATGSGYATTRGVQVAVPGVSVNDGGLTSLRVTVAVQGSAGTVTLTTTTGLTFDTGDGTADPTIEFRASTTNANTALATLRFTPAAGYTGSASIVVTVTDGTLTFGDHYYEYVADAGIQFDAALNAAAARTYYGRQGYLATITSSDENTFAYSKISGEGWIGAYAANVSNRQEWRWITGPEAESPDAVGSGGERGLPFFTGVSLSVCGTTTGTSVISGRYSNWASGEPNNACNELAAHFLTNGQWNDYNVANPNIDGYVVEYGGLSTDTPEAPPSGSANLTVTVAPDLPTAPVNPSATPGTTTATVSWSAPVDNGGAVITGYTVTSEPGGQTCTTSGATSCTVGGLTPATSYTFAVRATNSAGTGPAATTAPATTSAPGLPGAPVNPSATTGDTTAIVSWSPPVDDGGAAISGYTVTSEPGGQTCITSGATSCTVSGLTPGTSYTFAVRATNSVGTGPAASTAVATSITPGIASDRPVTEVNGQVLVTGENFAPNTAVELWLHSDPVLLTTVTTDANGAFSQLVTMPAGATGQHEIHAVGTNRSGQPATQVVGITITAPQLAITGSQPAVLAALASMMVLAGMLLVRRSERLVTARRNAEGTIG
jgi:hypothetical protein